MSVTLSENQMKLGTAKELYQMEGTVPLNDEPPAIGDRTLRKWSFDATLGGSFAVTEENESRNTMRIRITNETSGRFKDLVINASEDIHIFDSIYDNHEVKTNHVRKWSSDKIKEVKAGTSEIIISVMNETTAQPFSSYSIDQMKKTSTRKLQGFFQPGSLINLLLRCERKSSFAHSNLASTLDESPLPSPITSGRLFTSDSLDSLRQSLYGSTSLDSKSPVSQDRGVTKGMMRVRVQNDTTGRSKDLLVKVDDKLNLYDSIYNHNGIKQANVRKWGPKIAKEVKKNLSEIKCLVWDESIERPYHSFSVNALKSTSTKKLFEIAAEPMGIIKLILRCEKVESAEAFEISTTGQDLASVHGKASAISSLGESRQLVDDVAYNLHSRQLVDGVASSLQSRQLVDDAASVKSRNLAELESIRQESRDTRSVYSTSLDMFIKETIRVRVANPLTSRYKDLVLDVRDDLYLFHAVYNNPAVKTANVRKWSSEIVQDVQNGVSEILLEIWDDSMGAACRTLSVNDLKRMSTKDLMVIAPETSDLIEVRLRCATKPVEFDTVKPQSAVQRRAAREANSAVSQPKRKGSGLWHARHMAHMSSGNMRSLSDQGLKQTKSSANSLQGSTSSFHDQINLRSDYQFGLSGLSEQRNHSWQASQKSTQQPQLFSSNVNASFSMIPKPNGSKTRDENKTEGSSQQNSAEKPVLSVDDKLQRFLSLSNDSQPGSKLTRPAGTHNASNAADGRATGRSDMQQSVSSIEGKRNAAQDSPSQVMNDASPSKAPSRASSASVTDPLKEFKRLWRSKQSGELVEEMSRASSDAKINRFLLHPSRRTTGEISMLQDEGNSIISLGGFSASTRGINTDSSKEITAAESSLLSGERRDTKSAVVSEKEKLKRFLSRSSSDFEPPQSTTTARKVDVDAPPVAEICVVTTSPISSHVSGSLPTTSLGISLSGDIVKEVFPYHVVLDSDFRILQVGNSLSMLFESRDDQSVPQRDINFIGRIVSDVFMITGPIPMFGKWDWLVLDRMRNKTIFFESVLTESSSRKVRLKGTIIEISRSPHQIMLSLLPNVKNLTELSDMELSMGNLPLHSCQREAVLLGEHSASEVKLTNHLDMLHRDLIDSMEQQIKDRTAELAMANQDLERANTKVQKQSARQLEHFACMSHEIRTPLNCIVGMSSILLEETHSKIDPMITESIEMIYNSGELLRAVVDDVLDYAKLESGSFEVDVSKINLQESLAGVVYSISQKIQEKNIRLRCYFSPDLPKFTETDSRRLQQVLFNLLGNSGKFSKRNSVIDLSVKLVPKSTKDKRERLAVDGQGDANELHDCDIIRFSVQDYGKGIEKKDFKTIFQPFSQASKHTATVYGGTGLGLSITSKLVHSLGGRIAVDSEIGKFTEFIVDLPLKGEPVDIAAVKGRLKDVCIITVKPKESIDYSFTTYPIAEEPEPFGSSVRDQYGLSVVSTQSVNDLEERVKQLEAEKSGKHFALLVNETLYDDQALTAIVEKLGHRNCTFMTFGPKNGIEATKQKHFRSLLGVFPSILLESIAKHVAHTKQDVVASDTKGSSALKSNPNSSSPDVAYVPEKAPKTSDPRSQRAESTKPTSAAKQFPPKRDLKVLYAEDNKINQKVLSRVLNRVGIMDVTIVDDGLKAVTICEKVSYDVIFMDMQMPVMDGVEACNLIIERDNDAKVIFVTAHALDEFKHKAKAAGGVGFISKPFRIEDIEKVLGQLDLDGKRNRRL